VSANRVRRRRSDPWPPRPPPRAVDVLVGVGVDFLGVGVGADESVAIGIVPSFSFPSKYALGVETIDDGVVSSVSLAPSSSISSSRASMRRRFSVNANRIVCVFIVSSRVVDASRVSDRASRRPRAFASSPSRASGGRIDDEDVRARR